MAQNWWEAYPEKQSLGQRQPYVIEGPPREPSPQTPVQSALDAERLDLIRNPRTAPQTPAQIERDRLQNDNIRMQGDGLRAKQDERSAKAQQAAQLRQGAAHEMVNVIKKARAAKTKSNDYFATGFGADAAKFIGGTPAADVDGLLDAIGSNTAFDRLQKMREMSTTGAALGSVSDRELDLLKSSVASPKQGQSDKQFRRSMDDIERAYMRTLVRLPGGLALAKESGLIGGGQGKPPQKGSRVIDFNDLPE